jgi:hypothetical protein
MKKTMYTVVMMGVLVAGPAMQASAINREWSAVLGFLGGYMVANGGLGSRTVVYQEPVYVQQPVYRETVFVEQPVVTGHYEYREQQIWEPGFWESIPLRCGRVDRVWHEGYYRTEMVRIWVDDCRPQYERRGRHRR